MAKKTKKQLKEEKLLIQRDRVNMFIQVAPQIIGSPIGQTLLWWILSRHIRILGEVNAVILGKQAVELFPVVDLDLLPPSLIAGALIEKTEDALGYKDDIVAQLSGLFELLTFESIGREQTETAEGETRPTNPYPEGSYYWNKFEEKHG